MEASIEEYKAALQEAHDRMFVSLRGCLADFQKEALTTDLRAQFAGQALQGLLANGEKDFSPDGAAKESVAYADALLAALNGGAA